MTKHRAGPARRQRASADYRHRAEVRPRYGRIVTLVSVVGRHRSSPSWAVRACCRRAGDDADPASADRPLLGRRRQPTSATRRSDQPRIQGADNDDGTDTDQRDDRGPAGGRRPIAPTPRCPPTPAADAASSSARAGSGSGWSTTTAAVVRTYLVSGQHLRQPGHRHVPGLLALRGRRRHRRLRHHEVLRPVHHGRRGSRDRLPRHPGRRRSAGADRAQLGTPLSHGCIRQGPRGRDRALGVRPRRHDGRRHRLGSAPSTVVAAAPEPRSASGCATTVAGCRTPAVPPAGAPGPRRRSGWRRPARRGCRRSAPPRVRLPAAVARALRGRSLPGRSPTRPAVDGRRLAGACPRPGAGSTIRPLVPGGMPWSWNRCSRGRVGLLRLVERQVERLVDHLPAVQVGPVDERDRDARGAGPAGAADPVDVGLVVLGAGVVDDVGDARRRRCRGRRRRWRPGPRACPRGTW